MKKVFALIAAFIPAFALASESGVHLDKHLTDLTDTASLQRGAQTFANYCMGCHSLEHARFNRVARDLGIPEDLMKENLIFADKQFGELMTIGMQKEDSKRWFGATPPDLTLVARVRRPDWVYTYMRSFYEDPSRPWGVNNVVFKDVGMPHVLADLQGRQVKGTAQVAVGFDTLTGQEITEEHEGVLYLAEEGKLSAEEYDKVVYDLVNFLVYMAEPIAVERERIGWWVLLFLAIFFVPVYMLNKEYWRDVK
ncbi:MULTISPECIES: cytochrome c1 [Thalassolituus]|jgi:ubiquinol-cytochrome c reductase cytochrome c1 subunit|uniref:cytochrome c1 n=1 Tax=Thalassolituus TaxID=187492 RepID=UPI000C49A325|nr:MULTISPECIES: cytochrome c1 [Thalassolituus]MAY14273.1 cytochrome c1 [Oceanospirillaceae bacterium]MCB2388339.1 cytochrome c1 [Thalassolituus alkanivorans]MCB2423943.1 cytochrome c1 [Thalassolituus alkanivorans]